MNKRYGNKSPNDLMVLNGYVINNLEGRNELENRYFEYFQVLMGGLDVTTVVVLQ